MNKPHPTRKSQSQIAHEWDRIALVRHRQIASGVDLTYRYVLVPTILQLCGSLKQVAVLDVGCGTGHLARHMSLEGAMVTGIDPSRRSIQVASKLLDDCPNAQLHCIGIEDFAATESPPFDIAVANMTLMDCLQLRAVTDAIAKLLRPGGALVATITHPWFWPKYWNYDKAPWFGYSKEIVIEASFSISNEATDIPTTHVHRPLEMYITSLVRSGFRISDILEPLPPAHVQEQYPEFWDAPRYLAFRALRVEQW